MADVQGVTTNVEGQVAQDAAVSGNPISIGARASDAEPSAVSADGDAVFLWANRRGALVSMPMGAPNIASGQVSVTSTATQIVAARTTRRAITIVQHGTTNVFIGPATITATTGVLLTGTAGAAITIETTGVIQGITASGTQTVSYIEEYI